MLGGNRIIIAENTVNVNFLRSTHREFVFTCAIPNPKNNVMITAYTVPPLALQHPRTVDCGNYIIIRLLHGTVNRNTFIGILPIALQPSSGFCEGLN